MIAITAALPQLLKVIHATHAVTDIAITMLAAIDVAIKMNGRRAKMATLRCAATQCYT